MGRRALEGFGKVTRLHVFVFCMVLRAVMAVQTVQDYAFLYVIFALRFLSCVLGSAIKLIQAEMLKVKEVTHSLFTHPSQEL